MEVVHSIMVSYSNNEFLVEYDSLTNCIPANMSMGELMKIFSSLWIIITVVLAFVVYCCNLCKQKHFEYQSTDKFTYL